MRTCVKRLSNAIFRALMFPVWLFVGFADSLLRTDETFLFFAHFFAFFPGKLGDFIRRTYYWWTLKTCGSDLVVGFGSFFTGRNVTLGDCVWIGQYSIIGDATIDSRVLISDRVSVLTGRHQHVRDVTGALTIDRERRVIVTIGQDTWIGAGAIIMADVREQCVVGAGAVVVKPVPPGSTAVGVPARLVGDSTPLK